MQDSNTLLQPVQYAIQDHNYLLAERLASDIVRRYPLFEEAWILLGDSLYYQGCGLMAHKVYTRACLFHPQATWIDQKLKSLESVPKGIIKEEVEDLLKVRNKTSVGAAILAKNEESCIGRCLESLVHAVDEILVVDTGSTDRTIEIAKSFPKTTVVHFAWCDDFSAARNFGMSQMESDWVLWVDADKHLHPDDVPLLHYTASLLADYEPHPLLHIMMLNQMGDRISINYGLPRFFPIRGHLRYYGRIHEQLGPIRGNRYTDLGTHDFFVRIRLFHDGYDPQKTNMERKLRRNIELLENMTQDEPDDPTWWLYLGRESLNKGDLDKGIQALRKAEEKAKTFRGFGSLIEVLNLLVSAYLAKGELSEAEKVCDRMVEANPTFPDSYYYLGYIQIQKGRQFYKEVEENLKKSKALFAEYRGLVSPNSDIVKWKADLLLADLYRLSGETDKAKKHYLQVLAACPASYKQRIEKIVSKL
ncbi:glycosyltransferase [Effusibacillus dendaii]|nr:glycosyltransferase [Effusibacillus dendaii]